MWRRMRSKRPVLSEEVAVTALGRGRDTLPSNYLTFTLPYKTTRPKNTVSYPY